ncbi:MAG: IS481 family transposase [Desulfobacteraceae bacterium]
MEPEIRMRLKWVIVYEKTQNAGRACLRCGISRPTLRKWWNRYQTEGLPGLKSRNRKPLSSPQQKVFSQEEEIILQLRTERKLGVRRIKNELFRGHNLQLGLATIHKVLTRNQVIPLKRKRPVKTWNRYECPIPGERVQMDTCKIAPGLYLYTAVDDCTRYMVVGLYPKRMAAYTLDFLERVFEETPFAIQRFQTDRGREFFAHKVQEYLMEVGVKFRPIKPRSPHLNGKVERAQKIVLEEFFSTVAMSSDDLADQLQEWQHYYNWHRGHGAHNGKTPMDCYIEKIHKTPLWEDVGKMYKPSKERLQEQDYRADLWLRRLGGCPWDTNGQKLKLCL